MARIVAALVLAAAFIANSAGMASAEPEARESVFKNIAYIPGGSDSEKLDVHIPANAPKPLPVVLYLHGGGWSGGDKANGGYARTLTKYGYAVVSANYRLSGEAPFPAQIEDCKAAVRWIRANAEEYGFDPKRIGVTGNSAGGHLSSLLAATSSSGIFDKGPNLERRSDVQAALVLYGPEDLSFYALKRDFEKTGSPSQNPSTVNKFLGAELERSPEKAKAASPISYIGPDTAPILIIHGTRDKVVPSVQSVDFIEALKKAGGDGQLILIEGMGHGPPSKCFEGERAKAVLEFLDSHLKRKAAN